MKTIKQLCALAKSDYKAVEAERNAFANLLQTKSGDLSNEMDQLAVYDAILTVSGELYRGGRAAQPNKLLSQVRAIFEGEK